jgi:flagellar biogenesis protein FliO
MNCRLESFHVVAYVKVEKLFGLFLQMIILLYLIVIFGWALLIMIIKCRKAREKRIALAQQEGE